MNTHHDSPGLTTGEPDLTEIKNGYGQHYFKARAPITSVFGSEVDGQIEAVGRTRAEALERLEVERRKLYETLWL